MAVLVSQTEVQPIAHLGRSTEMPVRRDTRSLSHATQLADLRAQASKLIGGKADPAASEAANISAAPVRGALDYLPLILQYAGPVVQLFRKARSKTQNPGANVIDKAGQQRGMRAGSMAMIRRLFTLAVVVGATYAIYRSTRTARMKRGTSRSLGN